MRKLGWSDDLHALWASKHLQTSWITILRDLELLNTQSQRRRGDLHALWASQRLQTSSNTILRDVELLHTHNQRPIGDLHALTRLE